MREKVQRGSIHITLTFSPSIRLSPAISFFMVVLPGEEIAAEEERISGHGTYEKDRVLRSTVVGEVQVINKLITVPPLRRLWYTPEVGDVVVGRVDSLGSKRWNVDINSAQEASLLLTAINLPGNVQRRKIESDELMMREYFDVGDVLAAEVQSVYHSGVCHIHTRSERYKKLENGVLVQCSPMAVKREKSQFLSVEGVEVIIGINGYVWIGGENGRDDYEIRKRIKRIRKSYLSHDG